MRHFAWALTWMVVGLATTLAAANVLMHSADLRRATDAPAVEPIAQAAEPAGKPIAKSKPPVEFSRSVTPASYRQRDRD
jgi:hypothetical protein